MRAARKLFGVAALAALALALNMLAFRLDLFGWQTLAPLAAAVFSGMIWLILTFILKASAHEGGNALHGLSAVVGSAVFLGICIAVYAFLARWDVSWDLTHEGRRDLSDLTVQLLGGLDQEVEVYCLFSDIGTKEAKVARDKTQRFLERCQKHTDYLSVTFMDPQKEGAKLEAMGVAHPSPQGTVIIRAAVQENREADSGQQVTDVHPRQEVIRLSGVSPRLEERYFTNTLYKVIRESRSKLCFLQGHNERTNITAFKKDLADGAYETEDVAIQLGDPKVPEDCDVLVIDRLESNLDPAEMEAIDEYLGRGGRLFMLLDPVYQAGMTVVPWLRDKCGIEVGEDLIVSPIDRTFGMLSLLPDSVTVSGVEGVEFEGSFSQDHPITRGFKELMHLRGARSVTLAENPPGNIAGTVILRTPPLAWAERGLAELQKANAEPPTPDEDELTADVGVAVAVTMKTDVPIGDTGITRDARIVVVGDSDITTDESFGLAGHRTFLLDAVAWLTEREELIAIRPALAENPPIYLTESQQRTMGWIATLGTLQVPLVLGLAVYLKRRKYQ
jgi:gliding motility-associatede transport system auxiliary component